jgi:hypothetical protein
MNAIKKVRRYLVRNPEAPSSLVLRRLATALGEEREFAIFELYEMDLEAFDLAVELLQDWRLDRYYASRIRLFDTVLEDAPAEAHRPVAQVRHSAVS